MIPNQNLKKKKKKKTEKLQASIFDESVWNARDLVSVPGSGRSPGEGNGNPFQ